MTSSIIPLWANLTITQSLLLGVLFLFVSQPWQFGVVRFYSVPLPPRCPPLLLTAHPVQVGILQAYVHESISVQKGVVLPKKSPRSHFERPFTPQNQPVRPRDLVKTHFKRFPTFNLSMSNICFRYFVLDFFGVENPLDVVFVRILRFLTKTDYATRLLAVFCFRWTCSQPCTPNNGQTSVLTKVVLCMAGRADYD